MMANRPSAVTAVSTEMKSTATADVYKRKSGIGEA